MNEQPRHLATETLQAYLDGELGSGRREGVEAHLATCARCAAELEAWRGLFGELGELPPVDPSPRFREAVLARLPVRPPLRRRLLDRVRALLGPTDPVREHLPPERLQDLVEGVLRGRVRRRVEAHLAACGRCAGEAARWRQLFGTLEKLPELAPSPGFARRVMTELRAREAPSSAPAFPGRGLAAVRRLVPSTWKGWTVAGGLAAAPAAGFIVVLGAIVAHPLLTVRDLAAFLWWQTGDLLEVGASWMVQRFVASPLLGRAHELVEAALQHPAPAVGGLLAAWITMATAGWILYRNVISPSPLTSRHVQRSS